MKRKQKIQKNEEYYRIREEVKLESRRELYDWMQCFMAAIMICVLLFVYGVRLVEVIGSSMNPTLYNGEKLIVSNLFYEPKVGDIVIFKTDSYNSEKALVKRVIAVEGQTVNIDFDKGIVYVDGEAIQEDYIADLTYVKMNFIGPQEVPENCVFVMGDNRNASVDSRDSRIGMVDKRLILGKAYYIMFPFNLAGKIE